VHSTRKCIQASGVLWDERCFDDCAWTGLRLDVIDDKGSNDKEEKVTLKLKDSADNVIDDVYGKSSV